MMIPCNPQHKKYILRQIRMKQQEKKTHNTDRNSHYMIGMQCVKKVKKKLEIYIRLFGIVQTLF